MNIDEALDLIESVQLDKNQALFLIRVALTNLENIDGEFLSLIEDMNVGEE